MPTTTVAMLSHVPEVLAKSSIVVVRSLAAAGRSGGGGPIVEQTAPGANGTSRKRTPQCAQSRATS